MSKSHHSSAGFTLIEVGIIVPILLVTVLVLFDALFAMIRSSTIEHSQIDMTYDKQITLANIESDVILTSSFLPTIDSNLSDPYTPTTNGGIWSYKGDSSSNRVLILRAYSTTTNPLDTTTNRQPVFIDDNDPVGAACNPTNIYTNDVQQYNVVYFVKNSNLYRRRIVDTATPYCNPGQYQKQSCPSAVDLGTPQNTAKCKADDELLLKDVTNFNVSYYDEKTDSDADSLDVYDNGADADLVTTALDAKISITITRKSSGQSVSSTASLRLSKLNSKVE